MVDKYIQYLQIDYLQLFRLARQRDYVKRKRKMPIEYDKISRSSLVCRNLLKSCLTRLFEPFEIETRRYGEKFFIWVPTNISNVFDGLFKDQSVLEFPDFRDDLGEISDALKLLITNDGVVGYCSDSYYRRPERIRVNLSRSTSPDGCRPQDRFYNTMLKIISFKEEKFDRAMEVIRPRVIENPNFFAELQTYKDRSVEITNRRGEEERARREEQRRQRQEEQERMERERIEEYERQARDQEEQLERERESLRATIQSQTTEQQQTAQSLFDEALSRRGEEA